MAQYKVQGPDGQQHIIEGPDGASDEEVIAQAQQLFGNTRSTEQAAANPLFKSAISQAIAQRLQQPRQSFQQSFNADINQQPQDTNPTGQRFLQNLGTVADGYGAGNLAGNAMVGAANKIGGLISRFKNAEDVFDQALSEAQNLHGTTDSLASTGNTMRQAANDTLQQANDAKNALYEPLHDAQFDLPNVKSAADNVLQQIGKLPKSIQTQAGDISGIANDLANGFTNQDFQTVNAIRSQLNDLRVNGEGLEKLYAGQLTKALDQDISSVNDGEILSKLGVNSQDQYAKAKGMSKLLFDLNDNKLVQAITDRGSPEKLVDNIFNTRVSGGFKGNLDNLYTAQSVLGDEGYQAAKSQFFNQLTNSPNITKTMSQYNKGFLEQVFQPQEIDSLNKLSVLQQAAERSATLKKVAGDAAKKLLLGGTAYGIYRAAR